VGKAFSSGKWTGERKAGEEYRREWNWFLWTIQKGRVPGRDEFWIMCQLMIEAGSQAEERRASHVDAFS
jgi:hypothetical protein